MLTLGDIQELLGLEVLGVVPESKAVLTATNLGQPVIMTEGVGGHQSRIEKYRDLLAVWYARFSKVVYHIPSRGFVSG